MSLFLLFAFLSVFMTCYFLMSQLVLTEGRHLASPDGQFAHGQSSLTALLLCLPHCYLALGILIFLTFLPVCQCN